MNYRHEPRQAIFDELTAREKPYFNAHLSQATSSMLEAYAGDYLSDLAIDTLKIQELADQLTGPYAQESAKEILSYWLGLDRSKILYAASLHGDIPAIDSTAQGYNDRLPATPQGVAVLEQMQRGNIEPDVWLRGKIGVDAPEIARMTAEVNVESTLGRAVFKACLLDHLAPGSPEQFSTVQEIETVHAPVIDVFGMSALEMAMRKKTLRARLLAGGKKNELDLAASKVDAINRVNGQETVLVSLFGTAPAKALFEAVENNTLGEPVQYKVFDLAEASGGMFEGRLYIRTKTPESIADKMVNNPHYSNTMPQDIIGIKVVVPDEAQLASCMEYLIKTVYASSELTPVVAASKKSPVTAQGRLDYLTMLESRMDSELFKTIQTKIIDEPDEEVFRVVKITFVGRKEGVELPTELQGMTYCDRRHERHVVPHFTAPKGGNVLEGMPTLIPPSKGALADMHQRKSVLLKGDPSDIVPIKSVRGYGFSRDVLNLAGLPFDATNTE